MNGRSAISERCDGRFSIEAELEFDQRIVSSRLLAVHERVGPDLSEGGLEHDEIPVVSRPTAAEPEQLHRAVKSLQSIVKLGEGRMELKRR
jgi:hypothetical protein